MKQIWLQIGLMGILGWVSFHPSAAAQSRPGDSVADIDPAMLEVTSVSELTDVQPSDWAYQALESLIRRYGALTGYPDRRFRGNRTLSRDEFAAALYAFLQKIQQQVATDRGAIVLEQEDILTLKRLQAQYKVALPELANRLTDLETRTLNLQGRQFSPTTKLQGQAILAFTGGSAAGTTVVARTRLDWLTNFTPKSRLVVQLETGNNGLDAIGLAHQDGTNLLGTTGLLADGGGLDYTAVGSTVILRRLSYTFMPLPDLAITAGPQILPRDFIDRNSYANNSAVDFSSSFFVNNPLIVQNRIDRPGGAGAALVWKPSQSPFTFRALYAAANANLPTGNGGLLGGNQYQGSAEVEYRMHPAIAIRLQYTNANIDQTRINAGGINGEWAMTRKMGLFGRYGFGTYQGFNNLLGTNLDLSVQTWAIGVGFRDIGIPGTIAGIAIGQPLIENQLGNATQTNYEVFYNLFLSDTVSLTPTLSIVTHPNNRAGTTIWQGTVRTVFSF
ncbi:iron uptake porin [Leptolyngbya sp. 'hensonii']|uniref:iron uptake porin n=1 Tax=Leptolyngbya sp. 'hensonii' TaxID=1922337 RepID=UPI000B1F24D9|nr:iron uptake porin [Leptolyngbya sp. 'hensonii']